MRFLLLLLTFVGILGSANLLEATDRQVRITPVVKTVQQVSPTVVNIHTTRLVEQTRNPWSPFGGSDDFFNQFFRFPDNRRQVEQRSLGSGVIVDAQQALVLTNAHVIDGASLIGVRLLDGRQFEGQLIGLDPDFDLAILRLQDAQDLPEPVLMGDSSDIMIGETIIAIGNPFGFGNTVTTGVVSAVERTVETKDGLFTDFIQTDAAINPGNSGGPLMNMAGELIGINTAIHAQAEGIGFAIPINKAQRVMQELVSRGRVETVWLGLEVQDVDERMAGYLGLDQVQGIIVVHQHEPMVQKSALHPGDVILAINGHGIENRNHYLRILRNFTAGQMVHLDILGSQGLETIAVQLEAFTDAQALDLASNRWGLMLQAGPQGLTIVQVKGGSPAHDLGLQAGDTLVQVAGVGLKSMEDFAQVFKKYRLAQNVLILVARNGHGYYLRLRI